MKFKIVFKDGSKTVHTVEGVRVVDSHDVTVADVAEHLVFCEGHLEKLTGLRVHIELSYDV